MNNRSRAKKLIRKDKKLRGWRLISSKFELWGKGKNRLIYSPEKKEILHTFTVPVNHIA